MVRTGVLSAALILSSASFAAASPLENWAPAWGASVREGPLPNAPAPSGLESAAPQAQPAVRAPIPELAKGTLRYPLTVGLAGDAVRIRISNEFGASSLGIGAASVAIATKGEPSAVSVVRFGGATSVDIPSLAPILSDPVPLKVKPGDQLIVSLYVPAGAPTKFGAVVARVEFVEGQNETATLQTTGTVVRFPALVSEIDVRTREKVKVVVALGDSITEGLGSASTDAPLGPRTWPEHLGVRLREKGIRAAVVNAGISGNRLLTTGAGVNALARFDRDVAAIPKATHLLVAEGINDLGFARQDAIPSADQLIAAYKQILNRAHSRGLKVIGATITPSKGAPRDYWTPEKNAIREAVNKWIRTPGNFDGIVDFDAAVRDPNDVTRLKPELDSGDHLHPSAAGYAVMGAAIDVNLFK